MNKIRKSSLPCYFSIFLLLFDLFIPILGPLGSTPASILISSIEIIKQKRARELTKTIHTTRFLILTYLLIFCYSIFIVLINGAIEPSYITSTLKATTILCGCILFYCAFSDHDISAIIINVFAINASICLIAGSNEHLLQLVYIFKKSFPETEFISYRNSFLAGSGYFGMAAPYATVFSFAIIKIANTMKSTFFDYAKIVLIGIAGILAGRTMLVSIFFSAIFLTIKNPKKTTIITILLLSTIAFILTSELSSTFSGWVLEPFSGETQSTNELASMYFMPGELTLLFGDGQYSNGNLYYMNTDAGYMRNILFGGIPILLLTISTVLILATISKNLFFSLLIVPLTFILHSKGVFIINNPTGNAALILLALSLRNKNYHDRSFSPQQINNQQ